jgi:2,5-diamino-6-(ribosylamino)-4(3H)-pyrimidinone 5'-phosphate reductase
LGSRRPRPARPWVSINMVSTIDGKTVSGGRNEPVNDLGSSMDHKVMRVIEEASDAVMIGAGSLRATPGLWYPKELKRIVVSASGDLPFRSRFFTDAPEQAWVATVPASPVPVGVQTIVTGPPVNLRALLRVLFVEMGVEHLLVEGGSELNAALLAEDHVDELFLTLAPKVKLGRDVPTYAGGEPLGRDALLQFRLVSSVSVDDEVFVRYQRRR